VARKVEYRIYCLTSAGRIGLAEEIDARTDAEAIDIAHDLKRDTLKCEVWKGNKLVATLDRQDPRD
jgi:hypothetical protein